MAASATAGEENIPMDVVITALLILLPAVFVAWPFLSPAPIAPPQTSLSATDRRDAERQKSEAYAAIKEAEFDFEMGKLSEADLAILREKYAALAMTAISVLQADLKPVSPRRSNKANVRIAFCPQCGNSVPKAANFCGACGTSLEVLAA